MKLEGLGSVAGISVQANVMKNSDTTFCASVSLREVFNRLGSGIPDPNTLEC